MSIEYLMDNTRMHGKQGRHRGNRWPGSLPRWYGAVTVVLWLTAAALVNAAESPQTGCSFTPYFACASDDHRLEMHFVSRFRYEYWDARADASEDFVALRSRISAKYTWKKYVTLFGELQNLVIAGLTDDASGAAALYRSSNGDRTTVDATDLRQLWLDIRPIEPVNLRIGRQDINMGTLLKYPEGYWQYLKIARLSQRLVGTVGWTHAERSYDGVTGTVNLPGYFLHLFAAEPTTGVFAVRSAYERQKDVLVGAADFTVKRGTWLNNTEFTGFFLGYADDRDPDDTAGLFGDIRVYTLGASLLGVYPFGPGRLDVILWGAYQFGDYTDNTPSGVRELDQNAWAFIGEFGYQFPSLPFAPWVRTGVNVASGDDDSDDGTHQTFFNVLPTNHLYYGYADQFAFQNLINWFFQLKFKPTPKMGVDFYVHRFWLFDDNDLRYFGTGAFNRSVLGFGGSPSNGSRDVGTEVDVVVSYRIDQHWSLLAGYSFLWGGDVFATSADRDTRWAFSQVVFKY